LEGGKRNGLKGGWVGRLLIGLAWSWN